jgi:hypothetical protein
VSIVNLSGSTARRLYFDGDNWCLELESWQSVDRDVFAPITSIVQGPETILPALLDVPDGRDLTARAKVILQDQSRARVSFAVRDAQFLAEPYPANAQASPPETPSSRTSSLPPNVQRSLADLKTELDTLRAQVRELELLISKFEPHPHHTSNENAHADEEANFDAV